MDNDVRKKFKKDILDGKTISFAETFAHMEEYIAATSEIANDIDELNRDVFEELFGLERDVECIEDEPQTIDYVMDLRAKFFKPTPREVIDSRIAPLLATAPEPNITEREDNPEGNYDYFWGNFFDGFDDNSFVPPEDSYVPSEDSYVPSEDSYVPPEGNYVPPDSPNVNRNGNLQPFVVPNINNENPVRQPSLLILPRQDKPHQNESHQHEPHEHEPHEHEPHEYEPHEHEPHEHEPHEYEPHQHEPHQHEPYEDEPHQDEPPHHDEPHQDESYQDEPAITEGTTTVTTTTVTTTTADTTEEESLPDNRRTIFGAIAVQSRNYHAETGYLPLIAVPMHIIQPPPPTTPPTTPPTPPPRTPPPPTPSPPEESPQQPPPTTTPPTPSPPTPEIPQPHFRSNDTDPNGDVDVPEIVVQDIEEDIRSNVVTVVNTVVTIANTVDDAEFDQVRESQKLIDDVLNKVPSSQLFLRRTIDRSSKAFMLFCDMWCSKIFSVHIDGAGNYNVSI